MQSASLEDPGTPQKQLRARLHNAAARRLQQWRSVQAKPELLVFRGPGNGVANWPLSQACARDIAGPYKTSLAGFRGLSRPSRPHSWGFEAFRGLARPRQNRKTPLACKITRPRGLELI